MADRKYEYARRGLEAGWELTKNTICRATAVSEAAAVLTQIASRVVPKIDDGYRAAENLVRGFQKELVCYAEALDNRLGEPQQDDSSSSAGPEGGLLRGTVDFLNRFNQTFTVPPLRGPPETRELPTCEEMQQVQSYIEVPHTSFYKLMHPREFSDLDMAGAHLYFVSLAFALMPPVVALYRGVRRFFSEDLVGTVRRHDKELKQNTGDISEIKQRLEEIVGDKKDGRKL